MRENTILKDSAVGGESCGPPCEEFARAPRSREGSLVIAMN